MSARVSPAGAPYDLSVPWWGPDGPGGSARTPTFIVSHSEPEEIPEGRVHTFVNSPEEALELARAAAGDKDVDIFSANVGQQLLRAGRVDEIQTQSKAISCRPSGNRRQAMQPVSLMM